MYRGTYFPNNFEIITPVFGKGNKSEVTNYRVELFLAHKLFSDRQFGYRSGRSTVREILKLFELIRVGYTLMPCSVMLVKLLTASGILICCRNYDEC